MNVIDVNDVINFNMRRNYRFSVINKFIYGIEKKEKFEIAFIYEETKER